MPSTELHELLRQAIESAKSGDKARARGLLIEVTEADPNNEVAWMWRASVSLTPKDAAWCLTKVLNINPANRQAQEWLDKIRQLQDQPPAVTRPLVTGSPEPPGRSGSTGAHQVTPSPDSPTVSDLPSFSAPPSVSPDRPPSPTPPRAAATVQAMPAVTAPRPAPAPVRPAPGKTGEMEKVEPSLRPEPPPGAKVILAVDDSLTVRRVITQALESQGYRVITAADGYEALAKLKDITPDLVILDVALPGDGMATNSASRFAQKITAQHSGDYALQPGEPSGQGAEPVGWGGAVPAQTPSRRKTCCWVSVAISGNNTPKPLAPLMFGACTEQRGYFWITF